MALAAASTIQRQRTKTVVIGEHEKQRKKVEEAGGPVLVDFISTE
jgi:hypothetical protein